MRSALDALGEAGVHAMLLEGGPHLAGAFFDAGEIDEVAAVPGADAARRGQARDPLEGEGVEQIADAMRALTLTAGASGDDVVITARLREW